MIKLIVNDCWMELKGMVRGRKKSEWMGDVWMVLYFALLLPYVLFDEGWFGMNECLWSGIFWIIFWTGLTLCRYHQNRLEKIFYLLPVTEKDKKSYLLAGYWFRVLFLIVPLGCYLFTWTVVKKMSFLWAGYCLLHCFLIICMTGIDDISDTANTVHVRGSLYMANTVSVRGSAGSVLQRIMSYGVTFVSIFILYEASFGHKIWGNKEYWPVDSTEMLLLVIEIFFALGAELLYWCRIFRELSDKALGDGQ